MFLKHETFSTGSSQEIKSGFIVFLLSHLGRFTLLVRMETTLHLHHTHNRSFILRMGSHTPELIHTTTKVKRYLVCAQGVCAHYLSEHRWMTINVKQLHFACRWICRSGNQPCCYPGAPAGQWWRRGFGHARWSSNWFGSGLPLLCLLVLCVIRT